jgi:hypothetical protein
MKLRGGFAILLGVLLMGARPSSAAYFDYSVYDGILHHYVDEDGFVDYDSIRLNSMTALEGFFEAMANADLAGWPAPERQSFWINAFNARMLYRVAQHSGGLNKSDIWALLERPSKIAGQMLSPADIRKLLRKEGDPRLLFALSDGTLGGPKLYNKAYTPDNLDLLLQTNASAFVNSPLHVTVVNDHLKLSTIFNLYAKDFEPGGGIPAFMAILLNSNQRSDADLIKKLLTTSYQKTSFMDDWTINDLKNKPQPPPTPAFNPGNVPPDASSTSDPDMRDNQ